MAAVSAEMAEGMAAFAEKRSPGLPGRPVSAPAPSRWARHPGHTLTFC